MRYYRRRLEKLIAVSGTCTVAVLFDDHPATSFMFVDTAKFNAKANMLRTRCVENAGSGGYFHGVRECNVFCHRAV